MAISTRREDFILSTHDMVDSKFQGFYIITCNKEVLQKIPRSSLIAQVAQNSVSSRISNKASLSRKPKSPKPKHCPTSAKYDFTFWNSSRSFANKNQDVRPKQPLPPHSVQPLLKASGRILWQHVLLLQTVKTTTIRRWTQCPACSSAGSQLPQDFYHPLSPFRPLSPLMDLFYARWENADSAANARERLRRNSDAVAVSFCMFLVIGVFAVILS